MPVAGQWIPDCQLHLSPKYWQHCVPKLTGPHWHEPSCIKCKIRERECFMNSYYLTSTWDVLNHFCCPLQWQELKSHSSEKEIALLPSDCPYWWLNTPGLKSLCDVYSFIIFLVYSHQYDEISPTTPSLVIPPGSNCAKLFTLTTEPASKWFTCIHNVQYDL